MFHKELRYYFFTCLKQISNFFILTVVAITYTSCSNNNTNNKPVSESQVSSREDAKQNKALIAPNIILISNPKIVIADTCPPPINIIIPKTNHTITSKDGKTLKYSPPETTKAGFLSIMQNYNTDDGLAIDFISCGLIAKRGDLWFGTEGGGVSRYDGKSFTNYTIAQGLANNFIKCMLEDIEGNIWFGTHGGGASKYDGKSFINYTTAQGLANDIVLSITEDQTGNIWLGTKGGISKFNGKSFINFTTQDGLANNFIRCIIKDKKGNLWFGTSGGGVSKFDGKTFTNYTTLQGLAMNTVWSIKEDKSGNIWFGTYGGGVSRYNGKSFTNYTTVQGLPDNVVFSISEDKTGNIWFGTQSGVCKYDGGTFTNYTTAQGLANNIVKCIIEDKTGNLWIGTKGGGICKYDGKSFTNYTTAQGLANNVVFSIKEDKTGNLWFGTNGGGVCKYDGNRVEAIESGDDIAQKNQQDLKKENGKFVKSFTNYTKAQGLANDVVLCITKDKTGNLWFGTEGGGLCEYDGKSFTNYTMAQGLVNDNIKCIIEDKLGNLWFVTTKKGICKYDGKRVEAIERGDTIAQQTQQDLKKIKGKLVKSFTNYTSIQGLANNDVTCITEDKKGNLWFGTFGGGVSKYDGQATSSGGMSGTVGKFTNFSTAQGLSNADILCITEDKSGNLWFGTSGAGICRYDGKSFTNYSTAQGLPDNTVTQILIDSQQHIIIGTNLGIAVLKSFAPIAAMVKDERVQNNIPAENILNNEELKNYIPVFEIYNSAKGYPVKDVNAGQNTMFLDSNGKIWIATGSDKTALVRFDYASLNKNEKPPDVFIHAVKINNSTICWYDLLQIRKFVKDSLSVPPNINEEVTTLKRTLTDAERDNMRNKFGDIKFEGITKFYPLPENLILPQGHNSITFDFAANELSKPYLIQYQYILEGYENEWNPVTNKTTATFGNIFEGSYTFKLKAQSPFGVWSEPITYSFKVLPPWWRTWWMYSIYGISAIILIVSIVWLNGKRLRARATELAEEVRKATITITEQKIEVEEQKKVVEGKNKDIIDSINYAKRIQVALLKEEEHVSEHLPEHFIFFKPKDIVSGDFYWALIKGKYFYLAAVDCTGHGVPGAFMSMLGIAFLNEINADVQNLSPAEILNQLRNKIIKELKQTGMEDESKDGMDISLICLDLETKELQWAGANNPLYLIKNDVLSQIKPNKQPISYQENMLPFSNHILKLEKGTAFYLFTDGFADQFGGVQGKKFKYKSLQDFLVSISKETMVIQKQKLKEAFEDWKGNLDQVDDVCLIGVRV